MITKEQIKLAKESWEEARNSAALAHQCWALLMKSHNALLKSYQSAGFKHSEITAEFEKLMKDHAERYKAALEHMDNMARIHGELIEQLESENS
jgi:vacuolar-type H+-ATPase subunit D/Vma8